MFWAIIIIYKSNVNIWGEKMTKRRGRGEGGIEQLPSGKWRATRRDGSTRERKTFDSKQSALDWLHEALSARRGEWATKKLSEWFEFWFGGKADHIEPATLHWYRQRYKRRLLPVLGGVRLGDLSPVRVKQWMVDMVRSGASVRERHGALKTLRAALQDAVRMGQLGGNPASAVRLPKLKHSPMSCLDRQQVARLLGAAAADRFAAFYWLAIDTGMRPGELFALHWPSVNLSGSCVTVERSLENVAGVTRLKQPKTDRKRVLPIAAATVERLKAHRLSMDGFDTSFGPVFVGVRGALIDPRRFNAESFRPVLKAAGLPAIRIYDLRHTSATLLLEAGVNIKVVSERLGHSDIATTLRHYAHVLPSMQDAAVKAIDGILSEKPTESPFGTE